MDTLIRRRLMMQPQGEQPLPPLPSGYQEVEYVHVDGSSWISTGLTGGTSGKCAYRLSFRSTDSTRRFQNVIGGSNPLYMPSIQYNKDQLKFRFWNSFGGGYQGEWDSLIHTAEANVNMDGKCYWDNEEAFNVGQIGYWHNNIWQYGSSSQDRTSYAFIGDLFTLEMWDVVKVRHYTPCRRLSDGDVGFFDRLGSICDLTGTPFYINAGTGTMTAGPDVTE